MLKWKDVLFVVKSASSSLVCLQKDFIIFLWNLNCGDYFKQQNLAQIVQSHTQRDCHGVMKDLHDSPAWKKAFSHNRVFGGDPRGIAFSLCTDGLNPYNQNRVSYSTWPIEQF